MLIFFDFDYRRVATLPPIEPEINAYHSTLIQCFTSVFLYVHAVRRWWVRIPSTEKALFRLLQILRIYVIIITLRLKTTYNVCYAVLG